MAFDTKTSGARINVTIEGAEEILKSLEGVKTGVKNRVLRKAIRAALKPVLNAAKANVPVEQGVSPRNWLKKSLITRIATLRRDGVIGLVGPRTKYETEMTFKPRTIQIGGRTVTLQAKPRKYLATKYAHLTEFGVKPHTITPKSGPFKGRAIQHPGVQAKHWLQQAWNATKAQAASILQQEVAVGLAAEVEKYAAKGKTVLK